MRSRRDSKIQNTLKMVWCTNGLNMASIMGDVTEEELEQMIDSIYT